MTTIIGSAGTLTLLETKSKRGTIIQKHKKVAVKIIIRKHHAKLLVHHITKSTIVELIILPKTKKETEFIRMELGEIILRLVMLIRPKDWLAKTSGVRTAGSSFNWSIAQITQTVQVMQ